MSKIPPQPTDELLMEMLIKQKNRQAYVTLYQRHQYALLKFLTWLCQDVEVAKDLCQETFLKVLDRPQLFDTSKSFRIWLFSVARNNWKNFLRQKSRRSERLQSTSVEQWSLPRSEDLSLQEDRMARVQQVLHQLSDDHREVLVLKYSNNLMISEMADLLGCSEGTIKSRLFYAINHLKKILNHDRA